MIPTRRFPPTGTRAAAAAAVLAAALSSVFVSPSPAGAAEPVAAGASWRFLKGTAEASSPVAAWREPGFSDAGWAVGEAPFRYGDGSGGTLLDDMRYSYTSVFLRRTFTIPDASLVSLLELSADYDDGFIVWINGSLALDVNGPSPVFYDATASDGHESGSPETFTLNGHSAYLRTGENTIAVQVFNTSIDSSDVHFDASLRTIAPDSDPPTVVSVTPAPGGVPELTQIAVTFSEAVAGVDPSDLRVDDAPATAVAGSGESYIFTLPPVPAGPATVTWAMDHGITDTAVPPNPFDSTVAGEVRNYTVVDLVAPVVAVVFPPPGITVRQLDEVRVTFSEPVDGVDASDLVASGVPATTVTGSGAGPYEFGFPEGLAGTTSVAFAGGHGIRDRAADPNPLASAPWSYVVDPDATPASVTISEILASNRGGLADADGDRSDWIELRNAGDVPVDLAGWSLSDDRDQPSKFTLPSRTLAPGAYLVVFASGKDLRPAGGGEVHTNFKLSASGEFLGLFTPDSPPSPADVVEPRFPEQRTDHSYARDAATGAWFYSDSPTPGGANPAGAIAGVLEPPHTNAGRGFYDRPFDLAITHRDPLATIRYTTDGSEPTAATGTRYTAPLRISRTTVLRAAAFRQDHLPSRTVTHTYLYGLSSGQRSLPAISLVTDDDNLWGATGIMETSPRNTTNRGIAWERPVSAELIRPDDIGGFQADCGLRVQGGGYVRDRYGPGEPLPFSKYSFRLYFRGDYGPKTLEYPLFAGSGSAVDEFNHVSLRAGMNDHSNPFIVDELVRRLHIDTGHVGSHGTLANLYINGEYQGYYNPTERIDEDFLDSWYGDTGDGDWDVIAQFGEVREGDSSAWDQMLTLAGRDLTVPANYAALLGMLDVDNFIDYLLVNIYGGTGDWPHNNWRAARRRAPGERFRFIVWDAEWALGNLGRSVNANTITDELTRSAPITTLFQAMLPNPEFRIRFADRFHRHFFNGGALEDDAIAARYAELRSAMSGVLPGMDNSIATTWIPQRRGIILGHLADADLQRSGWAPEFSQFGGRAAPGFELSVSAPEGTVYYTLDGSDPRTAADPGDGGFSRTLVPEGAAKRVLVPTTSNGGSSIGTSWTGGAPFDDSGWTAGSGGIGYDEGAEYQPLIGIDVDAQMNDVNTSAYVRTAFTVGEADLEGVNFMQLRVRFDDGFIAYLNGVRITSANGVASPQWNSAASDNHSDAAAANLRAFNVTDFLGELRTGANVLAVHGLNDGIGSSDFLLSFTLEVGETVVGGVSPTAVEYAGPFPVVAGTRVRARSLSGSGWSAMTEALFHSGAGWPQIVFTEIMADASGGEAFGFVELMNAGDQAVDLSHFTLDGTGFRFAPGTVLEPGAYAVVASGQDPTAFATRYPGVVPAGYYGGSLAAGGERLVLETPAGDAVAAVEFGSASAGWPRTSGRSIVLADPEGSPDDPASWAASSADGGSPGTAETSPPPPPAVTIAEVLADNRTAAPNGGTFPDFVEFSNPGGVPVDLGGWGFSDDPADPWRFRFADGTTIPAGGRLVLWCDREFAAPGLHSGFGLDREGEALSLTDPTGARADAVSFGAQVADHSLVPAAAGGWTLAAPSPGGVGAGPVALAPLSSLAINEWLANPPRGGDDWLELFNSDATRPVALAGLHLSSGSGVFRYGWPAFLPPGGHLRLWADGAGGRDRTGFRIPDGSARLVISTAGGEEIDSVTPAPQAEGVSSGRLPDGAGNTVVFAGSSSPGSANYTRPASALRINELSPGDGGAPATGWFELANTGAAAVDLAGFSFSAGSREPGASVLPAASLAPGEFLTVDVPLPSTAGALFLFDGAGREIDAVAYGAIAPGTSIGHTTGGVRLLAAPTPGRSNAGGAALAPASVLRINEWLPDPAPGAATGEFVELFNPDDRPVALAGTVLSDDLSMAGSAGGLAFGDLTFISAGGFLALGADALPFGLAAGGETLRLYSAGGSAVLDEVGWGVSASGVSGGRSPDGGPVVAALPFTSPGASNTAVDPGGDSDGDGMPDGWELEHGLNPGDASDAATDTDGDGQPNAAEYHAGTDPRDGADHFHIAAVTGPPGAGNIIFTARAGIAYEVQITPSLATGEWTTVATIPPGESTRTESVPDPGAAGGRWFYRITATRP